MLPPCLLAATATAPAVVLALVSTTGHRAGVRHSAPIAAAAAAPQLSASARQEEGGAAADSAGTAATS